MRRFSLCLRGGVPGASEVGQEGPGAGMCEWVVHEVEPMLVVVAERTMPTLGTAVEAEIERLWQEARSRLGDALFNGRVFSAERITPRRVTGHFTEFRRIVAQVARPVLFATLGLRPLAVNGVVRLRDGILLGRRSLRTAHQAGKWQLPPAGSVDPGAADEHGNIDLAAQLLKELREEVGIAAERKWLEPPIAIIEHPGTHVLDIGIPVTVPMDGAEALALHARFGDGEYAPLRVVAEAEFPTMLAELGDEVVPSTAIFLRRLGVV
ncbi:MAG TPA: NUDIX domain-containing protein [Acetobacteraceae bacterium]|nr:NUDIX domain-containing protein [Acetobacteraceae bacterium]